MKALYLWCVAHPLLALALLTVVCTAPSVVWYKVREALFPGVETAKLPRWARVLQSLVELLVNVPGSVRALLGTGGTPPGTPPTGRTTTMPPPPALALLALVGLGGVLQGCPTWQRPACEAPGRYRCAGDRPEYCAPSRHWTPVGDVACGPREACSLRADGVARCAPAADGGTP